MGRRSRGKKKAPSLGAGIQLVAEVAQGVLLLIVEVECEEEVLSEAGDVIVGHIGADDGQQIGACSH